MKALIVIDMQQDYVGQQRNKKRYPYITERLVGDINLRIAEYVQNNEPVIYVMNRGKFSAPSPLIPEMNVVSDLIFEKSRASCFSDNALVSYLNEQKISQIELAGVDGNYCVGMSALAGAKLGFSICLNLSYVGIANIKKFYPTKVKLISANVSVLQ